MPTPQQDFRKQKISPNAAEGGENSGNGLKNLGKIVAEQAQKVQKDPDEKSIEESPNIKLEEFVPEISPENTADDDSDDEIINDKPMITGSDRTTVEVKEAPESAQGNRNRKKRNRNRNHNKNRPQGQPEA